ncbi:MAG: hypothetical protein AMJ67_14280 [Betaproteobacteria bacterium SG8_41]|nr:MAG: hypothetical protein AMJ67_14280 [Betaproteobacteria bacterium SG8_41]
MAELLISSIDVEGGGTLEVYATENEGSITFHIKTADGWNPDYNLDLNGLFLEYQEDGSIKLTVDGEKANNLNGTTYEGEKIYWDLAESTGSTVGGSDGITSLMECTVTVEGLTLADIDGGLIGIRATSTGTDGEGSLKLVGEIVVPEAETTDSYPDFEKDISHATLVFNTTDGDTSGDGYYTVKIDEWTGSNDLDAELDAILAWLIENDENITAETELLGAQLKGGNVGTADGSYDDFWANDGDDSVDVVVVGYKQNGSEITEVTSTDAEPTNLDLEQNGTLNGSDVSYDYDVVIG